MTSSLQPVPLLSSSLEEAAAPPLCWPRSAALLLLSSTRLCLGFGQLVYTAAAGGQGQSTQWWPGPEHPGKTGQSTQWWPWPEHPGKICQAQSWELGSQLRSDSYQETIRRRRKKAAEEVWPFKVGELFFFIYIEHLNVLMLHILRSILPRQQVCQSIFFKM